jgi:hypothetical protein
MTKREIGALAFTLLGIYVLVLAANDAVFVAGMAATFVNTVAGKGGREPTGSDLLVFIGAALPFLLRAGLGALLIVKRRVFSAWLFPESEQAVRVDASARDLQAVAFSVVGLLLFASALPEIGLIALSYLRRFQQPELETYVLVRGRVASLIALSVRATVGLALFFGARSLSDLWFGLKAFGHEDSTNGPE